MSTRLLAACRKAAFTARGFSLVEVMVALLVISVGLLGIAKMQALALSSTGTARTRSLAALEAAGLAATMHANRLYWAGLGIPNPITVTGSTVAPLAGNAGDCTQGVGALAPCTPAELAAADLQEWANSINGVLPQATTTIVCTVPVATPTCQITIAWTENAVAANKQEAAQAATPAAFQISNYVLYVEP